MIRSMKNYALTGLAALATSLPLAGCGTAQAPTQDPSPNPSVPTSVQTPKWFEGGLELTIGADDALEVADDVHVDYTDASGGERIAHLTFTGLEAPRTLATLNGEAIRNEVATERVDTGNGGFYDNVVVGTNPNAENAAYTQSALEETLASIGGSADAENPFYMVLGKDENGNYNVSHSFGAIAGPGAIEKAIGELYECARDAGASGELGDAGIRVMLGQFDSSGESSYGTVLQAYDSNDACLALALISNDADRARVADIASERAYELAPGAAAAAYLHKND